MMVREFRGFFSSKQGKIQLGLSYRLWTGFELPTLGLVDYPISSDHSMAST